MLTEIGADGHFNGIAGYGFDSVECEVRIASPEPSGRIAELASAAANDCYVTNTLKKACKVTGHIVLNGAPLLDL